MNKHSIKELKTISKVHEEIGYTQEDEGIISGYKTLYDILYALEDIRIQRGLTQADLATKSGLPRPEISKILSGKVSVSLERLLKITTALNINIELKAV